MNSKFKIQNSKFSLGFSLVDLIVSIAIIIVVTASVFISFRFANTKSSLERSAQNIALKIREAQNLSFSLQDFQGQTPEGYGAYFLANDNDEFKLYADLEPASFDYSGAMEIVETVNLENGILFAIESPNGATFANVNFTPPDLIVNLKDDTGDIVGPFVLKLYIANNPSQEKRVLIYKTGLVDIQ